MTNTDQNGHAGNGTYRIEGEDLIPVRTHAAMALREVQDEAKHLHKALRRNTRAQVELTTLVMALAAVNTN